MENTETIERNNNFQEKVVAVYGKKVTLTFGLILIISSLLGVLSILLLKFDNNDVFYTCNKAIGMIINAIKSGDLGSEVVMNVFLIDNLIILVVYISIAILSIIAIVNGLLVILKEKSADKLISNVLNWAFICMFGAIVTFFFSYNLFEKNVLQLIALGWHYGYLFLNYTLASGLLFLLYLILNVQEKIYPTIYEKPKSQAGNKFVSVFFTLFSALFIFIIIKFPIVEFINGVSGLNSSLGKSFTASLNVMFSNAKYETIWSVFTSTSNNAINVFMAKMLVDNVSYAKFLSLCQMGYRIAFELFIFYNIYTFYSSLLGIVFVSNKCDSYRRTRAFLLDIVVLILLVVTIIL